MSSDTAAQRAVLQRYVADLPIGGVPREREPADKTAAVQLDNLPTGLVTGSNLLEFLGTPTAALRSSVTLCLLAAQRVASNDTVVATPDQWIDRHNTVLRNLNWTVEEQGRVDSTFDKVNVAVHEAIIPFLTAALGGAAAASSLIVTALRQLKEMDKNAPWITLFERESQRFEVNEYQFSLVNTVADQAELHMAAARFDASYGRTQVLFFKIRKQAASFQMSRSTLRSSVPLLEAINGDLTTKLAAHTAAFIRALDVGPAP